MARKRTWAVVGLVAIAAAYGAGWWPEYQRRRSAEREVAALRERLEETGVRVRLASLLGDALYLLEIVAAMDYGQAQTRASEFFDRVGAEVARPEAARFRPALERVLRRRDGVIAALARGEPAALDLLRACQVELRDALGAPVNRPPSAPGPPPPK